MPESPPPPHHHHCLCTRQIHLTTPGGALLTGSDVVPRADGQPVGIRVVLDVPVPAGGGVGLPTPPAQPGESVPQVRILPAHPRYCLLVGPCLASPRVPCASSLCPSVGGQPSAATTGGSGGDVPVLLTLARCEPRPVHVPAGIGPESEPVAVAALKQQLLLVPDCKVWF
jgi:hypothetical protein